MNDAPCGNYCIDGFSILTRDTRKNQKQFKTSSSNYSDLKNSLLVANEVNFNQNKKHNSYTRYLLRKKGLVLKCQNC